MRRDAGASISSIGQRVDASHQQAVGFWDWQNMCVIVEDCARGAARPRRQGVSKNADVGEPPPHLDRDNKNRLDPLVIVPGCRVPSFKVAG